MKKLLSILMCLTLLISASAVSLTVTSADSFDPGPAVRTFHLSAMDFVSKIKMGWNLGNTLETHIKDVTTGYSSGTRVYEGMSGNGQSVTISGIPRYELDGNPIDQNGNMITDPTIFESDYSWSHNDVTTKGIFESVKAQGFNAVRIPVTWYSWTDYDNNDAINPAWMARVKQIVDWALECDLYVIVNMHHDDSTWLRIADKDTADYQDWTYVKTRYANIWKQIAQTFKDYDARLMFEGMNEPIAYATTPSQGIWTPDGYQGADLAYCYEHLNELYQIFVDEVRGTGGNNAQRYLMISTVGARADGYPRQNVEIPTYNGETDDRIIIDVHIYPGPIAFDYKNFFNTIFYLNYTFLSKGIPVVIGESAITDYAYNSDDTGKYAAYNTPEERAAMIEAQYTVAKHYNIPVFRWDNGGTQRSGKNYPQSWHMLNRATLEWDFYTEQLDMMQQVVYNKNVDITTAVSDSGLVSGNLLANKVWQTGQYTANGSIDTSSETAKLRVYTDKINVTPGETYTFKFGNSLAMYKMLARGFKADGTVIALNNGAEITNSAITVPVGVTQVGITVCVASTLSPQKTRSSTLLLAIDEGGIEPAVVSNSGIIPDTTTTTTTTTTTAPPEETEASTTTTTTTAPPVPSSDMIYDADSTALPSVSLSGALSLVDQKSPSGKALKVLRTSEYNNIGLTFNGDFSEQAQNSTGLKVWVAGDTNGALLCNQSGGISFAFKSGGNYYADTLWGICAADITEAGTWYTFRWDDRDLAVAGFYSNRITGSNPRTVDAASILEDLETIYITLGKTQSGTFSNYNNTAIYIDDLQFIND